MALEIRVAVARWAAFFGLWLVTSRIDAAALVVGATTAAAASWASLRLLPPGTGRLRPVALVRLALRFVGQSAVAGTDVARRALDPRLPLRPGFVLFPTRLPAGVARSAFCAWSSLLPGTLPAGSDRDGALHVHCLDVAEDVVGQMSAAQAAFLAALGRGTDDG